MTIIRLPIPPPREISVIESSGKMNLVWYQWFTILQQDLALGLTTPAITTAKLTTGGANGSMTFTFGLLTAVTAAT
jgi:hypothetical protein